MSRVGKYFCGVLINSVVTIDEVNTQLSDIFGEIELISEVFDFVETDYYACEMGDVKRYWVTFKEEKNLDELALIKQQANAIEAEFLTQGNRNVNLDPGYLTPAKVVLASTKNFTHRIYIGNNMFAEVTLYYKRGTFRDWPWSYADYKSEYGITFFNAVRANYMREVKEK